MAFTVRSVSSAKSSANVSEIATSLPSGAEPTDLLVLAIYFQNASEIAPETPAGWTLYGHSYYTGHEVGLWIFTKPYGSSNTPTVKLPEGKTASKLGYSMVAVQLGGAINAPTVAANAFVQADTKEPEAPAVTATVSTSIALVYYVNTVNPPLEAGTGPEGFTELINAVDIPSSWWKAEASSSVPGAKAKKNGTTRYTISAQIVLEEGTFVFTGSASDTSSSTDAAGREAPHARTASGTSASTDSATGIKKGSPTASASDTSASSDTASRAPFTAARSASGTSASSDQAVPYGVPAEEEPPVIIEGVEASGTSLSTDTASRSAQHFARTSTDSSASSDTVTSTLGCFATDTSLTTDTAKAAATGIAPHVPGRVNPTIRLGRVRPRELVGIASGKEE